MEESSVFFVEIAQMRKVDGEGGVCKAAMEGPWELWWDFRKPGVKHCWFWFRSHFLDSGPLVVCG